MRNSDRDNDSTAPSIMAGTLRRVEVITGTSRHRKWSAREKQEILSESFEPGANVSEVARRHGLNKGQLFNWRRQAVAKAGLAVRSATESAFAPVRVAVSDETLAQEPSGIEIEMGGVHIQVRGAVNETALRKVLLAVRSVR